MSSSPVPIYFVDAFTTNGNSAFTGNAAAVIILEFDEDIGDDVKQKIANETNLSDTAFVSNNWQREEKSGNEEIDLNKQPAVIRRTLRWFTPMFEVPLCGHATVATAKVLIENMFKENPELKEKDEIPFEFESRFRGVLGAVYNCTSERITLNFPINLCLPLYAEGEMWVQQLIEATVFPELTTDCITDIQYNPSGKMMLLRLGDHLNENDLRKISPDFRKMKKIENCEDMFGVLVTVKGKNGSVETETPHFYSRFFAPWYGVNEDPVCGSAHTVLTPYWSKEIFSGQMVTGETLLAKQHSERGGNLYCTLVANDRVLIGGEAKIVIRGELVL
ncbi:Phenazine biosynthesis-like domain-containing protein [Orchesella cincta]|uniref:Phenazine biosynthesis-like domain-containing protein n=1 Tax=Orchesella cincta TaxID=48709 RepID=A0A1D2MUJ8_ORCCI|nr:Phenazine biosynthesis-like domain-containing protein [Orchesella cincta]